MRINDKENYNKIRNEISMKNLGKVIASNNLTITKVAMNSKVSDSTIFAYISGQKIPSVPTLISIAQYFNCNIDYLLDRTNNPININNIDNLQNDEQLNLLIQNIINLSKDKRQLVDAYVQGLQNR